MKDSKKVFKRMGIEGIAICAACCLLPVATAMFGIGALTLIAAYLEWVGIIVMVIGALSFGVLYFRKRQAPACDIDCACKENEALSSPEK